jgi:hypothetical protein
MTKCIIKHGIEFGNGAAINVELGWIPNSVEVFNASDGTLVTTGYLSPYILTFTGGGIASSSPLVSVVPGSLIRGVTSLATAKVTLVRLTTAGNSWFAGTAAGILVLDDDSIVGTFAVAGEDIVITNAEGRAITTAAGGDATIPVQTLYTAGVIPSQNLAVAAAAAATTTAATSITRYEGVAGSRSRGFTIGATVAVEAKILRWRAYRDDA